MRKLLSVAALMLGCLSGSNLHAATMTKTYKVVASDFRDERTNTLTDHPSVLGVFSVTFDNAANYTNFSNVTVDRLTIDRAGSVLTTYRTFRDVLTIGAGGNIVALQTGTNDFRVQIPGASGSVFDPQFRSFQFTAEGSTALYQARSIAITEGPITKFTFTGNCTDCTGVGTGVLTLQNYTLGSALSVDNFVEWAYSSNLASYDITSIDQIAGAFNNQSGLAGISFSNSASGFYFSSSASVGGEAPNWDTGIIQSADYGYNSSWALVSNAPEPASWMMMVGGFGLIGTFARRRKAVVAYA